MKLDLERAKKFREDHQCSISDAKKVVMREQRAEAMFELRSYIDAIQFTPLPLRAIAEALTRIADLLED